MDAHASDPETAGGEPQFASRSRARRRCTASRPAACCTPARPLRATRGAARYAMPLGSRASRLLLRLRCLNPSLAVFRKIPSACRRRWSVIGGLLVAAVFIAVAVHAHSSRGAAVLAAAPPAKGGASQLFRGSEYLNRGHARRARRGCWREHGANCSIASMRSDVRLAVRAGFKRHEPGVEPKEYDDAPLDPVLQARRLSRPC